MNFRTKLLLGYIAVIVVIVGILGFYSIGESQKALIEEEKEKLRFASESVRTLIDIRESLIQEQVKNNLNITQKVIDDYGQIRIEDSKLIDVGDYDLPALYAGRQRLTMDLTLIEQLESLFGGISTVFQLKDEEFIRVSTNVRLASGERAVGTKIGKDSSVYQSVINNQPYYSRAWVVNEWHVTAYKPLLDNNDEIIGMINAGVPEIDDQLTDILSDIVFGETGYLYILDSNGDLIFHPTMQGENILEYQFVKNILDLGEGSIEYEFEGASKYANFSHFEPWDWYIVSTINIDDLHSTTQGAINFFIKLGLAIFLITMAVIVNQKAKLFDKKD